MTERKGQLPLALALAAHASFGTFVAGRAAAAVEHARQLARGGGDTLWLWGPRASGKTHLLQAACRAASQADRRAMYVPLRDATPAMLADLEHLELLALDDVDTVAGDPSWERALFVLLNEALSRRNALLLAAESAPLECRWQLRDLASRAGGAVTYRLAALADAERAEALQLHATARGLELEHAAAEFLVKRVARDMGELTQVLDRLDRASMSAQRRLTIPFIREQLEVGSRGG